MPPRPTIEEIRAKMEKTKLSFEIPSAKVLESVGELVELAQREARLDASIKSMVYDEREPKEVNLEQVQRCVESDAYAQYLQYRELFGEETGINILQQSLRSERILGRARVAYKDAREDQLMQRDFIEECQEKYTKETNMPGGNYPGCDKHKEELKQFDERVEAADSALENTKKIYDEMRQNQQLHESQARPNSRNSTSMPLDQAMKKALQEWEVAPHEPGSTLPNIKAIAKAQDKGPTPSQA